jgi:hypothetical protein
MRAGKDMVDRQVGALRMPGPRAGRVQWRATAWGCWSRKRDCAGRKVCRLPCAVVPYALKHEGGLGFMPAAWGRAAQVDSMQEERAQLMDLLNNQRSNNSRLEVRLWDWGWRGRSAQQSSANRSRRSGSSE